MADAFSVMMGSARNAHKDDADDDASDRELEAKLTTSVKRTRNVADAIEEDSPAITHRLTREPSTRASSPQRKRARTSGKNADTLDRPTAITYDRFRHALLVMAYAGLDPSRSAMNAQIRSSQRRADPLIGEIEAAGMSWMDAYQVMDTLMKAPLGFMDTLNALAKHTNPSENITTYAKLCKFMRMVLWTCDLTVAPADPALVAANEPCAVEGKPCKAREKLYRISVSLYEVPSDDTGSRDYRQARQVSSKPIQFHIGDRYIELIVGTWYLYHLSFLIAQNCSVWVEHVRGLSRKERDRIAPGFDAASDADLAHMYVAANHHSCAAVHDRAVRIAQNIDKRNQEYSKRLKKSNK